jgi:hypothetical protein
MEPKLYLLQPDFFLLENQPVPLLQCPVLLPASSLSSQDPVCSGCPSAPRALRSDFLKVWYS